MDRKDKKRGFSSLTNLGSKIDIETSINDENHVQNKKKSAASLKSFIKNFFSVIFGVLLLIPLQLYAIALAGGGLYYYTTSKDRELASYQSKISFYVAKENESDLVPSLVPGILPVDLDRMEADKIYFSLKDTHKPKSSTDVSTVVGFRCSNQVVGRYTDGASAHKKICDIYVIKVSDHTWSYVGKFTGSEPPGTKKGSGSKSGSHPVRNYLRTAGIVK